LERLAAAPESQAAYLRRLGSYPSLDELALEFDDAFVAARHGLDESTSWAVGLGRIDAKLTSMSRQRHADLWVAGTLTGEEWDEVRALACKAVAARRAQD
jgi:hypothetical protein